VVFRILLRPFIWRWLQIHAFYSDTIAYYLTNFMCFLALSLDIFSIFFFYYIVRHVTIIIFIDILVFIALLIIGVYKLFKKYN
ncbi:MerR family transcriptional regulator, partial [Clostridioides difficile]|nr:MerR family transcriptional regulator [Clostridioides difficile]